MPDDSLWIAVKDNIILSEYERCGIRLSDFTGTVVDAGAHVGLFSLRAAVHASRVFAIEPHPVTSALLTLNVRRNDVANVTVLQKALWSSKESLMIVEGQHSGANAVKSSEPRGAVVEAVTLDELLESSGPVDLLKIDIEGAEFGIIMRARRETLAKINTVVGELHLEGHRDGVIDVVEKLRSVGFSTTVLAPPVESWKESISRLMVNWGRLRGNTRLKLLVLAAYSYAAAQRRLERGAGEGEAARAFVYAQRGTESWGDRLARRAAL